MSTPMFDQYERLKAHHRDTILLFRLGDFYEMFGNDAKTGSRLLGLTLTQRQGRPMCGVPHHAAHGYIRRLLSHGKKVAICEQVSQPDGKSLTERAVVEVLSPGSVFDPDFLEANRNNYIVAIGIAEKENILAIGACDISTGEMQLGAYDVSHGDSTELVLRRELERLNPGEILVQESLLETSASLQSFSGGGQRVVNRIPDWGFDTGESYRQLQRQLSVQTLGGFGFDQPDDPALLPAATLLDYLRENAQHSLPHLTNVVRRRDDQFVAMDDATIRNLELLRSMRDGESSHTLIEVLDQGVTAIGSRQLRSWIVEPLRQKEAIEARLRRVDDLYHRQLDLQSLREALKNAADLERLTGRLGVEKAHPKDLLAIASTLNVAATIDPYLPDWFESTYLCDSTEESAHLKAVRETIETRIAENPPVVLNEGGIIRPGFDAELDRLRGLKTNGKELLDRYLSEQRAHTGISSLKIKYNRMIGHFFEVPRSQADRVPEAFIRRQSLANAERYTTTRLSEIETELNTADSAAIEREQSLFLALREELIPSIPLLQKVARRLGQIDAIASLAVVATNNGYRRPRIEAAPGLQITKGRHPVVEAHLPLGDFVPNDITLGDGAPRFALITGPNMAGKSTVLRQTALIVLLAHIGSFVPAEEATIGLCDRIFCRVGASDNIARGESTFLVEMNETSNILRNATEHSLVIMDEVGRGTSTHDGLAIAWAVCEYLLDTNTSRTLFATHYHELATIQHEQFLPLSMAVEHSHDSIFFLKRLVAGKADHSYGVDVARLAGLPDRVIARARVLLSYFEQFGGNTVASTVVQPGETQKTTDGDPHTGDRWSDHIESIPHPSREASCEDGRSSPGELFSPGDLLLQEIQNIDLNGITPREALELLFRWQSTLDTDRSSRERSQ